MENTEGEEILPIQYFIEKLPKFLFVVNVFSFFSFHYTINESLTYGFILKHISTFNYLLYKSVFYTINILLLNGWMVLFFNGWTEQIIKFLYFALFEFFVTIGLEFSVYFNIGCTYLNLCYYKENLELALLITFAVLCIFKYYVPIKRQNKYLKQINSDFLEAYKQKQKKLLQIIIFVFIYSFSVVFMNYLENFLEINKFLEADILHQVKQVWIDSVFNLALFIILRPGKMPNLYKEETNLEGIGMKLLVANLKKEKNLGIINLNKKKLKENGYINKRQPIIILNPFYKNKGSVFDELHTGYISLKNK